MVDHGHTHPSDNVGAFTTGIEGTRHNLTIPQSPKRQIENFRHMLVSVVCIHCFRILGHLLYQSRLEYEARPYRCIIIFKYLIAHTADS